jgi:hypothetical protein
VDGSLATGRCLLWTRTGCCSPRTCGTSVVQGAAEQQRCMRMASPAHYHVSRMRSDMAQTHVCDGAADCAFQLTARVRSPWLLFSHHLHRPLGNSPPSPLVSLAVNIASSLLALYLLWRRPAVVVSSGAILPSSAPAALVQFTTPSFEA